jgi:signal transduction histidine kinase
LASLLAALSVSVGAGVYWVEKSYMTRQTLDARQNLVDQLASAVRDAEIVRDDLALVNAVGAAARAPGVREVYWLRPDGSVEVHSDPARRPGSALPVPTADDLRLTRRDGRLAVVCSRRALATDVRAALRPLAARLAGVTTFFFALSLVAAGWLARGLTEPLRRLALASRDLAEGRWDSRPHGLDSAREDELGGLARDFDHMARRLKELDQMKRDFVSNVTHELRSPLSAIDGYVNTLIETPRVAGDAKTLDYLVVIRNNTGRLRRFIDAVLDLSKIDAQPATLQREPLEAGEVLGETAALFRAVAGEKGLSLDVEAPPGLTFPANPDQAQQVMTNFVSNALKFTPAGGRIRLWAASVDELPDGRRGAFVRLAVADTGPGIDPRDQERLFNRFEQVKSLRDAVEGPKGTGLGLAIARGLVEAHGGAVGLESRPGAGSVFSAYFPRRVP